jgi:hypothetical protein
MTTHNIFADNAGKYAHLNWLVFPLAAGAKVPMKGSSGLKEASANRAQIAAWAKQHPDANIGLRCGPESGVIVIDIDPRNGGFETVARLTKDGKTFPETVESATPSGGRHLFFAYDERVSVSGSNKLGRGVDVSTNGHAVTLPPSHFSKTGKVYRWVRPPRGNELPKLPRWAIAVLKPKPEPLRKPMRPIELGHLTGYRRQALVDLDEAVRRLAALHDGRHEAPFKVASALGKYVHHDLLEPSDLESAIMDACAANGALKKYRSRDLLSQIRNGLAKARNDALPRLARIHRAVSTGV